MTLKEKINIILINEKTNGVQFAARIGIQKSAVYNIINGKTKKLNAHTANKICKAFPKYTYKWLMTTTEAKPNTETPYKTFEDLDENDIMHIIQLVTQHFQEFMKHKMFKTLINNVQLKAKNEALEDLYINLEKTKAK